MINIIFNKLININSALLKLILNERVLNHLLECLARAIVTYKYHKSFKINTYS